MAVHQPVLAPHHIPRWVEVALAAVLGGVILLGALLVAGRVIVLPQTAAPVSNELIVEGRNGGGIRYTGIPYPATAAWVVEGRNGGGVAYMGIPYPATPEWVVEGRNGGGIAYMGIPYPAPKPAWIIEGRNGGGILYTGIPYPAPADQ